VLPSGDQAGWLSGPSGPVIAVWPLPSAFITQMSFARANAILLPSGE